MFMCRTSVVGGPGGEEEGIGDDDDSTERIAVIKPSSGSKGSRVQGQLGSARATTKRTELIRPSYASKAVRVSQAHPKLCV